MKPDLVKAALDNINAIMIDELSGSDPSRYSRVARLCNHAHQLAKMSARRVADVRQEQVPGYLEGAELMGAVDGDFDGADGGGVRYMNNGLRLNPILPGQPGDMTDMLRELMMGMPQFNPALNNTDEKRVERLDKLLDVRGRLAELGHDDLTVIDAKITKLTKELADDGANDEHPAVVRTLVPRGHQAGGDRRQDVSPDRREGDAEREGGARSAGGVGIEAGVVDVPDRISVQLGNTQE